MTEPQPEMTTQIDVVVAEEQIHEQTMTAAHSAVREGKYKFVLEYGGQGSVYWDELAALYEQQGESVRAFIDRVAHALNEDSSSEEATTSTGFERVLDIKSWFAKTTEAPASDKLSRAFFSYPLIALTQAANYLVFLDTNKLTHEDVVKSTACAIGFSQGVVSGALFAAAKTREDYETLAVAVIRYMFWHGLRAQEAFVDVCVKNEEVIEESTPMLAVRGLTKAQVLKAIEVTKRKTQRDDVHLSLVNGKTQFSITGLPSTLELLKQALSGMMAKADENQNRVPHSSRKPTGLLAFVPVSCPFHSTVLAGAKESIVKDVERIGLVINGSDLQVPVYSTTSEAHNLQDRADSNVVAELIDMQLTGLADWTATWKTVALKHADASHVLDFGTDYGASKLSGETAEGLGMRVVACTAKHSSLSSSSRFTPILGSSQFASSTDEKHLSWEAAFGPRINKATGKLENNYTRVLKKDPVMVAGMTPTTSLNGVDLVAAVQNAGFQGELAAGGLARPNIFEASVNELVSKIKPGLGVSINMLYLNAKQWGFQFPMVLRMRKSGIPIESITIGAGIPTKERAIEIVTQLQEAGINLIGLKPGSVDGINAVLEIASAVPTMNVMLQWTGGRAGGHHSFEDFHQPLESVYAAIRRVPNVLLVVGSGFGNWEDSVEYLTGDWSLKRGWLSKMPVDGVLLGSRVMVAKEAATEPEVKQLLVDTPGIASELEWEKSYTDIAGGIVTVTSELGEPIHKVANRCSLLWREFDTKYFSKPREEMELAIRLDKQSIIERLNADFQKPYFGCKVDEGGETRSAELEEMTYSEVLGRMIDLMFVEIEGRPRRWLHESFLDRVAKFMNRTEERFRRTGGQAVFDTSSLESEPRATLQKFLAAYPKATTTLLSIPDCDFFVSLCQTGGKPVNFVPVIDRDFKTSFKKDSLWYSEDLDAVPNRDAQRVCILQGPVAVRYSTVVDEPVGKILGDIAAGFTGVVSKQADAATETHAVQPVTMIGDVNVETTTDGLRLVLPEEASALPNADAWFCGLASLAKSAWLASLLSSKTVARGHQWVENPVHSLFRPQPNQVVLVKGEELYVFDKTVRSESEPVLSISSTTDKINVTVYEPRPATADLDFSVVDLRLKFSYHNDMACAIHQDDENTSEDVKAFYARFWVAEKSDEDKSCAEACAASVFSTFSDEFTVSSQDAAQYNAALGLTGVEAVPTDFATIACWKPLIKSVFTREVNGNLLSLVHLKHSYKLLAQLKTRELFKVGDELVSKSNVSSLRIIESGTVVAGVAIISRKTVSDSMEEVLEPLVELKSEFLIRGKFANFGDTFSTEDAQEQVTLARSDLVQILESKAWYQPVQGSTPLSKGDTIQFSTTSRKQFSSVHSVASVKVSGAVYREDAGNREKIAEIAFESNDVAESPVKLFIDEVQQGSVRANNTTLPNGGYTLLSTPVKIEVPQCALAYAVASRDLNPIHRSKYAALLANLPGGKPIMHGMWSATKVRAVLVEQFGSGFDSNVTEYDASFDGMVYPGDSLFVQVRHIGLKDGQKVLSVEVVNQAGERVVSARAQVKEPATAFVFTGQGSAEVGMGMDRYKESPIARDVWDRGDQHLRETYGFSILDIVRKNPSSISVHFGGKKGRHIRENYMKLRCEDPATGEMAPLLPEINVRTQSFTFSAPEGLLFATQFSQPALVLLEKAMFSEIQAAELIPDDAFFAGHSLGEYAGLSSFAGALAVEDVAEVVFLRGLIMQKAVKRDENGRSDYGMVAANPIRVGPHFTEAVMHKVVDAISESSSKLLQVVNYNVQGLQYVVAGENVNLEALSIALSSLKTKKDLDVGVLVAEALEQARAKKEKAVQSGKPFIVARGLATIPLVGIDVPFHSKELLGGVPAFRSLLRTKFDAETLERQLPLLVNRYIPNLVAIPFSLERSYFEKVFEATKSPYLAEVLDPMQWELTPKGQLVHLLVVELLAYQFASPVQWIKTQAHLFSVQGSGVRRFVEIGPAPTLTNMAARTLQMGKFSKVPREILWYQRDRETVHFQLESEHPSASEFARSLAVVEEPAAEAVVEDNGPKLAVAPPPAQVHVPAPVVQAAAAAPVDDAPVSAIHVLRILLASRLNKPLSEVSADTDVKALSAGKSAVQNEIVGDLEKEFGGNVPDGAAELPLKELANKFGSYKTLGKVTSGLISKMVASKMPGGFSMTSVKSYLNGTKGLPAGRTESVLAHSLLLAPQARLKSEAEAKQWLDTCVDGYASFAGISLAQPSAVAMGGVPQFAAAPISIPTVDDKPVDAKHALMVLLAAKLGKSFSEISSDTTIKDLAAGKSAVQNEIVGDLEKEFGSGPDDAAETKLSDLATKFPGYTSPGKVTSALIAKLLAGKMPGGFGLSSIKAYLSSERCLPAGRIESVLLHSLTQNPKQRFADEAQAKAWLDGVVDDYAKFAGVDIPYLSKLGGGGVAMASQSAGVATIPTDFDKRLKELIADQVQAMSNYLGNDPLDWHQRVETEVELREQVENSMSVWVEEHGDVYGAGIKSLFDPKKERVYDSYWNWAMQDAMLLYYRTITADKEQSLPMSDDLDKHFQMMSGWINNNLDELMQETARPPVEWFKPLLCNRATPELMRATLYFVKKAKAEGKAEHAQAIQLLVEQIEAWLSRNPVNLQLFDPVRPQLRILETGELEYSEVPRTGVTDSIDYVDEIARGLEYRFAQEISLFERGDINITMESAVGFEASLKDHVVSESPEDSDEEDDDEQVQTETKARASSAVSQENKETAEGPKLDALRESLLKRAKKPATPRKTLIERSSSLRTGLNENLKQIVLPHVHIRKPSDADPTIRLYDVEMTCKLLACMREMATTGMSFSEKVALVTGCGRNSIGAEVVKSLLEGGATVFVTTSSFNSNTTGVFRSIYEQHGSRGSRLILVPFNQGSKQDVAKLIQHIYDEHKLDVDFVVPFAALSEVGRTIADIDSRSELAHRIMLTNTTRLLGDIVNAKKARGIITRPALAILPMSPNHGNFGGDGLYAESKLGIESLMNKWYSEGWEDQLSVVGAVIGWTRGTGLMSGNNIVAEGVEQMGMRTFSTQEMGFNLSALLHPTVVDMASEAPLWADLTGGMAQVKDLKTQVESIRSSIMAKAKSQAALYKSSRGEAAAGQSKSSVPFTPRANLSGYYSTTFPSMSGVTELASTKQQSLLKDMINLRNVVVVAGFGEVSPWGNARTRWEMESFGEFSLEGCLELAWLTGYITYDNGNWLDAKTKEIVPEHEIKNRYEEELLKHSGIRIIEPELFDDYDPKKKTILHQVAIDKKMAPIEVADHEEALQFRTELGKENVDIYQNEMGAWMIRLKKGAILSIPRALAFDRFVAGQIPTGWSAERLGVPKDLVDSVDPVTLYTLTSTMEAFVGAGITDPYEFYQYVHVSEVGNASGGGFGGMRSFKRIYTGRLQGKSVASDTLQECFINTAPAWVNMLLLSSSGPIKTPVGACATAAESIDIGVETIKSGKARVVVVGGYDDFGEEGSYEFAQMKATSDSVKEEGMGRDPREMCRPCATTRGGFMESHGAGMQLLMDAQLAVDMGCPIYGIIALTNTATDKNGRSVPAPGQGILTTAREATADNSGKGSPLLDIEYRRRQFDSEIASIDAWYEREKTFIPEDSEAHVSLLEDMKRRKIESAQQMWGEEFFNGRIDIAPLRGALNVWNLTVDDIGVASFHGTGTKANDKNESEVTQKQLEHLGRSAGNPLPVVCQKNLTGHPKGAAAAWMFNGLLQVLNSGLIPGNRNLDNTCSTLRQFDHLVYPNRSMQTDGIKAAIMKSFGFGQAGGEIVVVHPDYLLSLLSESDFQDYSQRRQKRLAKMNVYHQKAVSGKHKFIQVKDAAPYTSAQESSVYLDPTARAEYDPVVNTWHFGPHTDPSKKLKAQKRQKRTKSTGEASAQAHEALVRNNSSTLLSAMSQGATDVGLTAGKNIGIGVDVEPIMTFENLHGREDFIRRNFTDQEMAYCYSAPHPASSFAGRWAAKEAVIKAISSSAPNEANMWKGAGAPLREIEIFITASGAPSVLLSGHPLQVFNRVGLASLSVSISHSGDYAVAQAVASYDA
ncbi:hypothetical protein Poli38472_002494 [Pythium oligandrum]|uniref:Fatty acid synthase subunit alpha n=1 Tax=Pythium oligandrum TaxID=41045 RepID=A0A8K1FMD5_PYTOL|nr:hypothetical protein Poli38472_002494 [Pythium oligandrum]|eukprot:TMW63553.1 hypothetical protein Poli38472_002494 [Pythium oligandrum]